MPKPKTKEGIDTATKNFNEGCELVKNNPIFAALLNASTIIRNKSNNINKDGLAYVTSEGGIFCNPTLRADPKEWARTIAHCLLHLAMGHFQKKERPTDWNITCDFIVEKFLSDFNFCKPLHYNAIPTGFSDEEKLYRHLSDIQDKSKFEGYGTAGPGFQDMYITHEKLHEKWHYRYNKPPEWPKIFAQGLAIAVRNAVNIAAGEEAEPANDPNSNNEAHKAKRWFISSYPLLGAIAANFKIIYDINTCDRMEINIAAISPAMAEIYINPKSRLGQAKMRFVMAHELLHAALRHDARQEWRDAYLWNVACDFVINAWLTEMQLGERPEGSLYDAQFKGMSAEAVYDQIVGDMRTYRKLATLRGVGLGDILPGKKHPSSDTNLDDFYRRALRQGLSYHREQNRGYLPAGLIEEIRALAHPPIPWDVDLARWFDQHFTPIERKRSYARPSRRQSSTPNIPRPNWITCQTALDGRTFGVVLDTSGSMERALLATALGAIASYSAARDVPAARVIFCDADAHDAGYMKPEDITGTVKIKGRGGTVLQPGIDMLKNAENFPQEAPILIITDAECDKVLLYGREHAFLIPQGAKLPFVPKGKVFRMK